MNRRAVVLSTIAYVSGLSGRRSLGQTRAISPDLADLAANHRLRSFNRTATQLRDGGRNGARVSEADGDGVAYVEGTDFANGTIELDVRGKDVQQQSFVGIAFHGVDGTTYDAIYFRPFNFRAEDPARRHHAVQYVSHPAFSWQKLRAEHPGEYEQTVTPVPDPNAWFHVTLAIADRKVRVFVNNAENPSLVVTQLSERGKGLVGLWVGNNSGGDFAGLQLIPA